MTTTYPGPVVSAHWLAKHLGDPAITIVDATVHLPDTGRIARAEYTQSHIPGAIFLDFDRVADPDNLLPRKCPDSKHFATEIGAMGIDNDTHVIAYDTPGLYSAARVWWLFRHYGCDKVSILDGGLEAWRRAGLPIETGDVPTTKVKFHPSRERGLLARWPDVLAAARADFPQILDARTPGRFSGAEQDRYPGTRSGHIPHSRNLYWAHVLDPLTRCLLPLTDLRAHFEAAGIDYDRPVILTCGSGLTACILALALHLTGKDDWQVYDGSWDEWGRRADLPIQNGEPV
ncbi:MAG: 3-mercaptopyruvate sulfurtransferase [Rhodocyclaceae bacterium]|jgi:thiosulfate/3-mercaptopyruvate sulfurtransferase|nr:3-mercaptopyruvate sulfurtransferase [Rhodocyclaceae bacterium]